MQEVIVRKHVKVYTIDALKLALEVGSPKYVSTIMQTCFFKLANIIPADEAIGYIKSGIEKKFKKKGDDVVKENQACVDQALAMLKEVEVPASLDGVAAYEPKALITEDMGTFANTLMKPILHQKGDDIPVSAMSYDGSMPTATSKFEKRGIAPSVPKWDSAACIQCNQCVMACPHAAIRSKLIEPANLAGAPASFNTVDAKPPVKKELGLKYRLQVFIEDCTGCGVCVETCPVKEKAIHLTHTPEERAAGQDENVEFFLSLPDNVMGGTDAKTVKGSQFLMPYFEFSGACAGLRRNSVCQAGQPALRQPHDRRERDRLFVDLRRLVPVAAVLQGQEGPRSGLGELALRGQRGIRLRHAPRGRYEPQTADGLHQKDSGTRRLLRRYEIGA